MKKHRTKAYFRVDGRIETVEASSWTKKGLDKKIAKSEKDLIKHCDIYGKTCTKIGQSYSKFRI